MQHSNRLIDTENGPAAVRGEGFRGLGERRYAKKKTLINTDNSMVMSRGTGGGRRSKRVKGDKW